MTSIVQLLKTLQPLTILKCIKGDPYLVNGHINKLTLMAEFLKQTIYFIISATLHRNTNTTCSF